MASKYYYGVAGHLTAGVSSLSTVLPVDADLSGAIAATFVNGTDNTYLALTDDSVYELVKVTNVEGQNLTVVRGVHTTAQPFAINSSLRFEVTADAILENLGGIAEVTIEGTGLAEVTNPSLNTFGINVEPLNLTGDTNIEVLGTWPNIQLVFTPEDCCGDSIGSPVSGVTSMQGLGIADAYVSAGIGYVSVPTPNFTGVNVTITGTWPNLVFTATSAAGGTVTSVAAGAGITVTGSPTVNPTVAITNTTVTPGTYGGIGINSRGQITGVPATLNPVSVVSVTLPLTIVRVADAITLDVNAAAAGVAGVVPLADETDPFDPSDNTSAATPAVVALALSSLVVATADGASSYSGEADASYTNTIAGSATAIVLDTGEKALIHAEVTMMDSTTSTDSIEFGLAVFDSTPARVKANRKMSQCMQSMTFVLTGPVAATTLNIVTTTVPAGSSVVSYSLAVVKF